MRAQHLHFSMYGSYLIDCLVLKQDNDRYFIEYHDPWIDEKMQEWVPADRVTFSKEKNDASYDSQR